MCEKCFGNDDPNAPCVKCGEKSGFIRYDPEDRDAELTKELKQKVAKKFVEFLLHDPKNSDSILVAHNGK